MPVTHKKSDLYPQNSGEVLDAARSNARLFSMTGTITNAADDDAGSDFLIAEVPADAIPHESTFFEVSGDGYAQIQIGTKDDATALVNQTKATAALITPFAQGDANHGKPWWEVLGLAANPGGFIKLYKHAAANATGAGSTKFRIANLA